MAQVSKLNCPQTNVKSDSRISGGTLDLKFILVSTLILSPVAIAGQSYDLRELGEGYEDVIINHELPPGVYIFDVMTNGDLVDKKISISFVHSDAGLKPILTRKLLHTVGVDFSKLPKLDQTISDVGNVSGISEFIEQGNLTTNFDAMTLDFIVPQYYLLDKALNEKLDRNYQTGENLAFVTYYASGFNLDSYKSHSLNLDFGANYNGWSYRHSGAYFDSSDGDKGYNTYNNYIEKPLVAMKSKVRIGSSYTNQNDSSFSFIGASLKSESRMLPREMRGYAPVVSGIAQSNAIVEVFQNSSLIYREIVSPGYFEISNLRDTGSSGDLNVIITEENGEERKFIQPYASSSNMLREGLYTYYIDVGKHDDSDLSQAYFINSNLTYGLTKQLTGSFGALVSQDYVSYNTNFDFSLNEFGVFSLGYQIGSKGTDGYTLQASYAKDFSSTGTNVTFSNYIYESENWSSFDEYINWIDYDANELPFTNKKSRQGVNLTQRLPYGMSANISGYKETYWDSKETYNLTLSTAKSFSFGTISIMFNQISNEDSKDDKQLFANVNLPIGLSGRGSVNTSYRTNLSGQSQRTLGYSGTALDDRNLTYNVEVARDENETNGALNLEYKSSKAKMNVGYSKTKDSEAINYGVAGSIVAFDKGVVMSQPIGSTFAIVDTSGIEGVRVRSKPGVVTDQNGYALVDYVTPYEFTNVSIDTTHSKGLSSDTESVRVSPIEGAGVKASFDTRRGVDLLISSTNEGSKIPFGTSITVNDKPDVNVFGDDGQVYISSAPVKGIIKAYINGTSKKPCVFEYQIEEAESQFQFITTKCVFE